jgi:hypothetical protein
LTTWYAKQDSPSAQFRAALENAIKNEVAPEKASRINPAAGPTREQRFDPILPQQPSRRANATSIEFRSAALNLLHLTGIHRLVAGLHSLFVSAKVYFSSAAATPNLSHDGN